MLLTFHTFQNFIWQICVLGLRFMFLFEYFYFNIGKTKMLTLKNLIESKDFKYLFF